MNKNGEGYVDPTPDAAFGNIRREERKHESERLEKVSSLIPIMKQTAELAGFDVSKDGSPAIGGCAMTKEYTTVFHELLTDTYIIFFGERICYKVTNANAEFYEDLQKRNMASLSEAKRRY